MTASPDAIAIGIPVRNEVERLPRLLRSLSGQRDAPLFTLCLFFDNCDDGSRELIDQLAPSLPFAVAHACCDAPREPNVGAARAQAMDLALHHAQAGTVLTTDADSEPAADWIAANLAALRHADVAAGRIVRATGRMPDAQDRIGTYYDRLHALRRAIDPVPWEDAVTHHWTSAASLAMSAATYRRVGGFPALTTGEDAALADNATRAGLRLRRDARVVVQTSARRQGRAQHGFAATLASLDGAARLPDVVHPDDEAWRFRQHAAARACVRAGSFDALALALSLPIGEVEQVAAECANDEAFAARIVGTPLGGMRMIGLPHAEVLLGALEPGDLEGAA